MQTRIFFCAMGLLVRRIASKISFGSFGRKMFRPYGLFGYLHVAFFFCHATSVFASNSSATPSSSPSTRPAHGHQRTLSAPATRKKAPEPPPPASDIFLFSLTPQTKTPGASPSLGPAINITQRPKTYDNQPSFSPDNASVYYTSIRAKSRQSDLYRYDINSQKTFQLTQTPESEFSPTVTPDEKFLSTVHIEKDGKTQRLWKIPRNGGKASLILPTLKRVGYHTWGDAFRLIFFIVGPPHTLQMVDLRDQTPKTLAKDIGRCLQKIPNQQAWSFVDKSHPKRWTLMRLDLRTHKIRPIAPTLLGSEDYAWSPDGNVWMGKGATLYRRHPTRDTSWKAVQTLDRWGIRNIKRLAISPNGRFLALVNATP